MTDLLRLLDEVTPKRGEPCCTGMIISSVRVDDRGFGGMVQAYLRRADVPAGPAPGGREQSLRRDRKSTRLNSSH